MKRAVQVSRPKTADQIISSVLESTSDLGQAANKPSPALLQRVRPTRNPSEREIWTLPGFYGKSKITTIFGQLPIEALRLRDQVKTFSGDFVRIEWIDKIKLDVDFLEGRPGAQPVLIREGAFGPKKPNQNMLVSPAQTLRMSSMHGTDVHKKAAKLIGRRDIIRLPHSGFTYYMFHCGKPATVNVDGVWVSVKP